METAIGLTIPFLGTVLGAACVFFLKKGVSDHLQKLLLGFASGVMMAAAVWSLLIPAMEMSESMKKFAFVPALTGFLGGIFFLYGMDKIIPHLHLNSTEPEGMSSSLKKTTMLVLAVTLHNIPEGLAVGVVFAGALSGNCGVTMAGAIALAVGISIQNFPEGAIISMPLVNQGATRKKAFFQGVLSGVVEPVAAVLAIVLTGIITPALPYLLSFAAGAMVYVIVEELLPEASAGEHSDRSTWGFAIGFMIMMVLDVTLG